MVIRIPEFKGTISLTKLDIYPLDIYYNKDVLVEKLVLCRVTFTSLRV
jgi:hypothetical protein